MAETLHPWGKDRPASLRTTIRAEARAQCWVGEVAWARIAGIVAGPLPPVLASGRYHGGDRREAPGLQETIGFSFGILEAAQSLLVSADIVSHLVFEADKGARRLRDRPRLVVSDDFPELEGLDFPELKQTAARDYSVHLRPHLRAWHSKFPADHPRLISTWSHGPGPDPGEPYRFLDTKELRVRVKDSWSDLRGLARELGVIGQAIPLKALVQRTDAPPTNE